MTPGKETAILEYPNSSNFTYAGGLHSPTMHLAVFKKKKISKTHRPFCLS